MRLGGSRPWISPGLFLESRVDRLGAHKGECPTADPSSGHEFRDLLFRMDLWECAWTYSRRGRNIRGSCPVQGRGRGSAGFTGQIRIVARLQAGQRPSSPERSAMGQRIHPWILGLPAQGWRRQAREPGRGHEVRWTTNPWQQGGSRPLRADKEAGDESWKSIQ